MVREKNTFRVNGDKDSAYGHKDTLKRQNNGLPEKQLILRESLLDVLFENPHVKTIHNIAIALGLGFVLASTMRDYFLNNQIFLGFRLIITGFENLHIAIAAWTVYFSFALIIYFCFMIWAKGHTIFGPQKNTLRTVWDSLAILILFSYYVFSFRLAVYITGAYKLREASACFFLMEQTRLLMKIHAFVRSNAPKVLKFKEKSDQKLTLPNFSHYIYFLMVPTLLYKDEYPRTSIIRWNVVINYVMEFTAIVVVYSFIFERFFIPSLSDFGLRKYSYAELFLNIFDLSFASMIWMVLSFYLVLHIVQNFFAEILRFGDRMFYDDWWTSAEFTTFYRKWNAVVHDWLYTYVYKDCYENLFPGKKNVAKYLTFLLSAVVHEFIIMHALGFFFPVLFVEFFCIGTLVSHIKTSQSSILNVMLWLQISFGISVMMSGHMLEYFARCNNVPPLYEEYDFYIPRSLTCDCYK